MPWNMEHGRKETTGVDIRAKGVIYNMMVIHWLIAFFAKIRTSV